MRRLAALSAMLVASLPVVAGASPIEARLSDSGLAFVSEQAPTLVPTHLTPDDITETMYSCDSGDATFTQQNLVVDLTINAFSITVPQPGTLRLDVTISAAATGQAYFYHPFACYGDTTCNDSLTVSNGRAIVDFGATIDAAGAPHINVQNVDIMITSDQIDAELSGCAESGLADAAIDFFEDYGLTFAEGLIDNMAEQDVGPKMERMIGSFLTYKVDANIAELTAAVTGVGFDPAKGLSVMGDIDLSSNFPAAACVSNDPGEPAAFPGAAPDLSAGTASDVGVEVNLGLVQDALYHIWHEGLLCITPDSLATFGVNVDSLSIIGSLLPGFPEGTTFSVDANFGVPPTVQGDPANAGKLTLNLNQVGADLVATYPDSTTKKLHLGIDASVTAEMLLDPDTNSISLAIDSVSINNLTVDDQLGLTALGFDFARVKQLLQTVVLPSVINKFGTIPVTGPVFGGIDGMYVILTDLETTDSWIEAKANLLPRPGRRHQRSDHHHRPGRRRRSSTRPTPRSSSAAATPRIPRRSSSTSSSTSTAWPRPPATIRSVKFGEVGKTATYNIEAHAVDLAGNEDPVGAKASVIVDGVLPTVAITNPITGTISTTTPSLTWVAADDQSPAAKITARIDVSTLDPSGTGPTTVVGSTEYPAGTTTATTSRAFTTGKTYQVIVTVKDEAGNPSSQTLLFAVAARPARSSGGCSVGGHGSAPLAPVLFAMFALGLVIVRRARR